MRGWPERVIDCAARLETLYQLAEEADDPEADDALVSAWNDAEWALMAALAAAPARTPEALALKAEWAARLIGRHEPREDGGSMGMGTVLNDLVEAVARDARALAAGALDCEIGGIGSREPNAGHSAPGCPPLTTRSLRCGGAMARRNHADWPPRAAAASIQQRGRVFSPETVRALARIARKPLRRGADPERIAARLDDAAVDFLLWSRSDDHATAGKAAEWARGQAKLAAEFLAGFDMSPDPGARPVRAEALALLFEALPPGTAKREDVRRDLEAVRRLHSLAGMAAAEYERRKGRPRQSDRTLRDLFMAIAVAYLRACGGRLGASCDPFSGEVGGPLIRFAKAAVGVMAQRLPRAMDLDPDRGAAALDALQAHAASASRSRTRIRGLQERRASNGRTAPANRVGSAI
jgi:hypothetical protein